jgi:hypothetical protein
MTRENLDNNGVGPTGHDEAPPTSEVSAPGEIGKAPGAEGKEAEAEPKPDGARNARAKKAKAKKEGPSEPLPDETQPPPDLPKAKRSKKDYSVEDIIADDSDEDEYSDAAPIIPKLVDKLPKAKYIQVRGGKNNQTQLYTIKLDEEDQRPGELNSYVLTKKMRDFFVNELEYRVTKMNVCDVCTIQGGQFLYMYPAASGLSNNSWNTTRMTVLTAATRGWVIISTNMETREYSHRTRKAHLKSVGPLYPSEPIKERAVKAVQGGRLIDSQDHPVVKRLLGMTEDDEQQDDNEQQDGE